MKVFVPTPLHSYTSGKGEVSAEGRTLSELLADLDRRYPGIRFRMIDEQDAVRPHMRLFVNGEQSWNLDTKLSPSDEIHVLQALSGG
jgi:sulfur-carrier protein